MLMYAGKSKNVEPYNIIHQFFKSTDNIHSSMHSNLILEANLNVYVNIGVRVDELGRN
jgi:hypothetical protein